MRKDLFLIAILAGILIVLASSCKRLYFHVTEEVLSGESNRFTQKKAYYWMGRSIALTAGRFEITPGDSTVLFIEGRGSVTGVGEAGVATLDFGETARFFIALPLKIQARRYDTRFRAICEVTGSLKYGAGENLFVCQSGEVVVDSLKGTRIYGTFRGDYLNTSNKRLAVDGQFKANPR